jgi:hypothetical protein
MPNIKTGYKTQIFEETVRKIWRNVWVSQGKRCARCGKFVALKNTAKNCCSFQIVCQKCYETPPIIVMDELSFDKLE